jgi:hypothetical protein
MTVNNLAPRLTVMVALGATTHAFGAGNKGTGPHVWNHT